MHKFLRNLGVPWFKSQRFVFEGKAPEGGPSGREAVNKAAEVFETLAHDLKTMSSELDDKFLEDIRAEFQAANETNKEAVYQDIISKFNAKLQGKVDPLVLDGIYRELGARIEQHVRQESGEQTKQDLSQANEVERTAQLNGSREDREEIPDNSPASAYLDTFKNSLKLPFLATMMESMKDSGDPSANFENWPLEVVNDPDGSVAQRITQTFDLPEFPHGKGRNNFSQGLRNPDHESKEFKDSHEVLRSVVKHMDDYLKQRQENHTDMKSAAEKHPLGFTVGSAIDSLKTNWHRGSTFEKGAMIAGAATLIWLAWTHRDELLPGATKWKWSTLFKGVAGLWAVNYFAGKASKDGRTPTQRFLEIMPDIDDFNKNDNVLKGFGEVHGMRKDQEKLRTYMGLRGKDAKLLFRLYTEAKEARQDEIDISQLDFHRNEISGKQAFRIAEDLVQDTAVAEGKRELYNRGDPNWNNPSTDQKNGWKEYGHTKAIFYNKYIVGMKDSSVTVEQAVQNAMTKEEAAHIIEEHRKQALPTRAYEAGAGALKYVYDKTKYYGPMAAKAVWKGTEDTYDWAGKNIARPLSDWAQGEYRHYIPYPADPAKKYIAERQRDDLAKIIPPDFALDVDPHNPGSALILGYPGIPFEVKYRKTDGKEVAIIDGDLEFLLDDGTTGDNVAQAATLKQRTLDRVDGLVIAEKIPLLAGKKPEWDGKNKRWILKALEIQNANPALGLTAPQDDIALSIDPDGTKIKFFFEGKEIDFKNLEADYTAGAIQKVIREDSDYGKFFADLPIAGIKVTKDPSYHNGALIEGEIAGLPFKAVMKGTDLYSGGGIYFFDGTNFGGMDHLFVADDANGRKFVREVFQKIKKDPYFINPFLTLQAKIENADEGFYSRLEELSKTKAIGYLPSNVKGALNGKILDRQWESTLRFKLLETESLFEHSVLNKGAGQIKIAYQDYIVSAVVQLEKISQYMNTLGTGKDIADQFQDLLGGQEDTAKGRPKGLEYVNYLNEEYQQSFHKFRMMISSYDYEGLDGLDASVKIGDKEYGASDKAYKIYETLLLVWSRNTRHIAGGAPKATLTPTDKTFLDLVTQRVKDKLEVAARKGGGVIYMKDLPKSSSESDLKDWVKA